MKSKRDLKRLYQESDIFLFPSFCESFGMVVAEAMSCACAVITGPTGFAASLNNNVDAIVLQIPNETAVASALNELITNPVLKNQLQNNGCKKVQHLTQENYVKQVEYVINSIMSSSTDFS